MNNNKKKFPSHKTAFFAICAALGFLFACGSFNRREKAVEILDAIPAYQGAALIGESKTTYPDSAPSIIREYQSDDSRENVMRYYQSELIKQGWSVAVSNESDPYMPAGIFAEKNGWKLNALFYSTGKFFLRLYLN